ncbi:hypothetical protein K0M31_005909, partial [Melipona bicolor]
LWTTHKVSKREPEIFEELRRISGNSEFTEVSTHLGKFGIHGSVSRCALEGWRFSGNERNISGIPKFTRTAKLSGVPEFSEIPKLSENSKYLEKLEFLG